MPQCPASHHRSCVRKRPDGRRGLHFSPRVRRIDCITSGPWGNVGGIYDGRNDFLSTSDGSPGLTERSHVLWDNDDRIPQIQIRADATQKPTCGNMAERSRGAASTRDKATRCLKRVFCLKQEITEDSHVSPSENNRLLLSNSLTMNLHLSNPYCQEV